MATEAREAAKSSSGGERSDRLPRRFGRYLLFDRIGRGGMADIYLALEETDLGVPRRIVVKQILPELSRREKFAKMLIDEAKLVAELRHANVAQVTDLGREGDRLFIAMEYVEGFDLNQLLRQLSRRKIGLPAEFGIFIVREVLAALGFAHRAKADDGEPLGIVHRDVSPSNVLISFEGEVKLCDFGIAKALVTAGELGEDEGAATGDGSGERAKVIGKAAYMAPEQAKGEDIGPPADLFVAGIILWELCAGRRLYKGTEEQMLEMARAGEIPPLPERGLPDLPALQAIVDRAFAIDPSDRFETAEQMLQALDDYAMANKLAASQLRFGAFLSEHFQQEVILGRRKREVAARALDLGPPVTIEPVEGAAAEGEVDAEAGDAGARSAPDERAAPPERSRLHSDDTKRLASVEPEEPGVRVPIWAIVAAAVMFAVIVAATYVLLGG